MNQDAESPDAPGASGIGKVSGNVEMSHVRFGYLPNKPVLKDLSLVARQGSLTAIVGETGAGKTTIINLLMRFYNSQSGVITIDGRDAMTITKKSQRLAFAMVLQDSWLFHGSVHENIAYGGETITADSVIAAAQSAQAHDFIMRMTDGYGTILNEGGVNISKGQRQLLTIARAMLLDAQMLILDEATSNVDTRTERKIQEAMRSLMEGKTCFVIAHRLSTIQNADNILVIQDGNVVEHGIHRKLLIQGGVYASLYQSQFD
jgi:ATP-binding cassette subfamily B protein